MRKHQISFIPFYAMVFLGFIVITMCGNKVITTLSQAAPLSGRHTIVIDAGHGGEDGGATSCSGILESNLNLEIALRLNDLFHFLGYDTFMVRTTDTDLHTQGDTIAARKASDLKARVAIANSTDNCIWISIHQNFFHDDRYSGAQVFFAETEDSVILGKHLQRNLVQTVNSGSKRQAKKVSGVYLFEHIHSTAILVECGFLSNRQEEAKLRNADYQKQLCCVIGSTVGTFLS